MTVLLVLGFFVVFATAHNITLLEVPKYGDPRSTVDLVCRYTRGPSDPPLHSVKWYRDNDEIFRYSPGQMPSTRTFNATQGSVETGSCNQNRCRISIKLPMKFNQKISYTCEVSTEGPRFEVVKQTQSLIVAVTMTEDPIVSGIPGSVQQGEDLILNCSTQYSMPPASILWYIDGHPEKNHPWPEDKTNVTTADTYGLRASWRLLRLHVASARGHLGVSCVATQPTLPPYIRRRNATIIIARSPHLSMFTAYGSTSKNVASGTLILLSWLIQNFIKNSAFCYMKTTKSRL